VVRVELEFVVVAVVGAAAAVPVAAGVVAVAVLVAADLYVGKLHCIVVGSEVHFRYIAVD